MNDPKNNDVVDPFSFNDEKAQEWLEQDKNRAEEEKINKKIEKQVKKESKQISKLEAGVRGAAQSASYNTSDEIEAGLRAAKDVALDSDLSLADLFDKLPEKAKEAYGKNLEYTRGREKAAQEQQAGAYTTGELVGALNPLDPLNKIKAAGLGAKALKGAVSGAASAYGSSTDTPGTDIGLGATIGATVGGLGGTLGKIGELESFKAGKEMAKRGLDYSSEAAQGLMDNASKSAKGLVGDLMSENKMASAAKSEIVDKYGKQQSDVSDLIKTYTKKLEATMQTSEPGTPDYDQAKATLDNLKKSFPSIQGTEITPVNVENLDTLSERFDPFANPNTSRDLRGFSADLKKMVTNDPLVAEGKLPAANKRVSSTLESLESLGVDPKILSSKEAISKHIKNLESIEQINRAVKQKLKSGSPQEIAEAKDMINLISEKLNFNPELAAKFKNQFTQAITDAELARKVNKNVKVDDITDLGKGSILGLATDAVSVGPGTLGNLVEKNPMTAKAITGTVGAVADAGVKKVNRDLIGKDIQKADTTKGTRLADYDNATLDATLTEAYDSFASDTNIQDDIVDLINAMEDGNVNVKNRMLFKLQSNPKFRKFLVNKGIKE